MDWSSLILALCMGLALSAACGLRVFLPLLLLAAASRWCGIPVSEELGWIVSDAALVCLGAATLLETLAYYIPWLDNALDTVQAPLALVAGVFVMGGVLEGQPDWLQWGLAAIGGAGAAGAVKTLSSALRLGSSLTTGGLANGLFSTLENIVALVGAVMALALPVLAFVLLALTAFVAWRLVRRLRARRAAGQEPPPVPNT